MTETDRIEALLIELMDECDKENLPLLVGWVDTRGQMRSAGTGEANLILALCKYLDIAVNMKLVTEMVEDSPEGKEVGNDTL